MAVDCLAHDRISDIRRDISLFMSSFIVLLAWGSSLTECLQTSCVVHFSPNTNSSTIKLI